MKRAERPDLPAATDGTSEDDSSAPAITPIPVFQVFIVSVMRATEPLSFYVVFPFLPRLVQEMGVAHEPQAVGFYAGIVESLFAVCQIPTLFIFGRLSDRIGRKPLLVFGLFGTALSQICFGLSTTFTGIIISRCLLGFTNGNLSVAKSAFADLTDDSNRAKVFSWLPLILGFGQVLGPMIGGITAHPAERYPNVFGGSHFLERFPYFLPCAIAAALALVGAFIGLFFFEESLPRNPSKTHEASERDPLLPEAEAPLKVPKPTAFRDLLTTQLYYNLGAYAMHIVSLTALNAIEPLFGFAPIKYSGIAFSPSAVGVIFAIRGIAFTLISIFFFPRLVRQFGSIRSYNAFLSFLPFAFLAFPVASLLARAGHRTLVWVVQVTTAIIWGISDMGVASNVMIISAQAPSRADLGTLNGLASSTNAFVRAFCPFGASYLFALSSERQLLGGYLVHLVFACFGLSAFLISLGLEEQRPKVPGPRTVPR